MEKLKDGLIIRLKLLKERSLKVDNSLNIGIDKSLALIGVKKVFVCDYCIKELHGILEFQKISDSKN